MYSGLGDNINFGVSGLKRAFWVKTRRDFISIYLDANNLYGWAMSQYLPTRGFKLLTDEEVRSQFPAGDINTNLASISDTADTGYILEVDLEDPSILYDSHNGYPLAVESLEISRDMLSPITTREIPS